jgi:hypothetical protein
MWRSGNGAPEGPETPGRVMAPLGLPRARTVSLRLNRRCADDYRGRRSAVGAAVRSVIGAATSPESSAIGTWPQPGSGMSCAPGMAAAKRGAVSVPIIRSRVPNAMRTGTRMSLRPVGAVDPVVRSGTASRVGRGRCRSRGVRWTRPRPAPRRAGTCVTMIEDPSSAGVRHGSSTCPRRTSSRACATSRPCADSRRSWSAAAEHWPCAASSLGSDAPGGGRRHSHSLSPARGRELARVKRLLARANRARAGALPGPRG